MRFYNLESALSNPSEVEELVLHGLQTEQLPAGIYRLYNLKKLELSNSKLRDIPSQIRELKLLESLNLAQNRLPAVPEAVMLLPQLKTLNLSQNEIDVLPGWVGQIDQLEVLMLSKNLISEIPVELCRLSALRKLDLSKNQVQKLPPGIGQLQQLRQLNLAGNFLRRLPKSLTTCAKLDQLDLAENRLAKLPETLGDLTQLNKLNLAFNRLKELPLSLGNCHYLRQLMLEKNQLEALPKSIGKLQWLASINCSGNKLQTLPDSIGQCSQLQQADFSENRISSIPSTFSSLYRLFELSLTSNNLKDLPRLSENLKILNVNKNRFEAFPNSILQLRQLISLNLSHNRIKLVPDDLRNLKQLEQLSLQGNPITREPGALIYLDQLKSLKGFSFYKPALLFQFIRACRKKEVSYSLRQALYAIFRGDHSRLHQLPLTTLFLALQLRLPQLDFPIRKHLFQERSLPMANHPLQKGSRLVILGKTHLKKKDLEQRLEKLGIGISGKKENTLSHVLIGQAPTYEGLVEKKVVFLSEKDLNDFLNEKENRYLAYETAPEKLNHLRQLLLHESTENVWLAIRLMEGGGVPRQLLTCLFYLWKNHTEAKIKASLKSLLEQNLSEESRQIIRLEGNINSSLSKKTLGKKLEKLGGLEEFDREELLRYYNC